MKPGLSRKFRKPWTGLYQITRKISEVNYEIMDQNNTTQIVHVNRLKIAHNTDLWKPKQHRNSTKKTWEKVRKHLEDEEEAEFRIRSLPMQIPNYPDTNEPETPRVQTPNTPDPVQKQMTEIPLLEREDRNYSLPRTHRSRQEMQPTRTEPPITRARARITSQEE
jgi:hypothetical protein